MVKNDLNISQLSKQFKRLNIDTFLAERLRGLHGVRMATIVDLHANTNLEHTHQTTSILVNQNCILFIVRFYLFAFAGVRWNSPADAHSKCAPRSLSFESLRCISDLSMASLIREPVRFQVFWSSRRHY